LAILTAFRARTCACRRADEGPFIGSPRSLPLAQEQAAASRDPHHVDEEGGGGGQVEGVETDGGYILSA